MGQKRWSSPWSTETTLPVRFDESQQTVENVSPTLGRDQLRAGIAAGLIGIFLVVGTRATGQDDEAERMLGLAADAPSNFLMVVPEKVQADPSISTE